MEIIQSERAALLNRTGEDHLEKGNFDAALNSFNATLELNPHLSSAYNNLGVLYLSMGRINEGLEQFVRALEAGNVDAETVENVFDIRTSFFAKYICEYRMDNRAEVGSDEYL